MPHAEQTEQEFLSAYDPGKYPRPSVTADVVLFTLSPAGRLSLLLIKRGGHPFKGKWALPGGFLMAGEESAEQAARRELKEETGLDAVHLTQLYTFSHPDRDPRTHVISVAYTALVPKGKLPEFQAGDDAADAALFEIGFDGCELSLSNGSLRLSGGDLAFDHASIVGRAIERLRGRVSYELDAFELLADKSRFAINDLRLAFEAVLGRPMDVSNFRKRFFRDYAHLGIVEPIGEKSKGTGARPAALYRFTPEKGAFS